MFHEIVRWVARRRRIANRTATCSTVISEAMPIRTACPSSPQPAAIAVATMQTGTNAMARR